MFWVPGSLHLATFLLERIAPHGSSAIVGSTYMVESGRLDPFTNVELAALPERNARSCAGTRA
jgi:hypothetical protein